MGNNTSSDALDRELNIAVENGNYNKVVEALKKGGNPNRLVYIGSREKCAKKVPIEVEKSTSLIIQNNNNKTDAELTTDDEKRRRDSGNESSIGNGYKSETEKFASQSENESTLEGNVFYARNSVKRMKTQTAEMNAFHRAARAKNNLEILKALMPYVKNLDEQDSNGDAALHHCVRLHNNRKMLLGILSLKPNIDAQNDNGETPLHSVVSHGCDARIVETLMLFGSNPNISDNRGETALHICARRRGIDAMVPGMLLRFGCNPNLKNNKGQTTLHVAAFCGNKTVLLLLRFNAKVRLRDNEGRLPSDVAATEEVRSILLAEEEDVFSRLSLSSGTGPEWNTPDPPQQTRTSRGSSVESYHSQRYNHPIIEPVDVAPLFASTPSRDQSYQMKRISKNSFDRQMMNAGGEGVIFLPDNSELVIPPDTMPVGTNLKLSIEPNDKDTPQFDFSKFDFSLKIKVQLPHGVLILPYNSASTSSTVIEPGSIPAFAGLCIEGDTTWRSERELSYATDGRSELGFKIEKKKSVPFKWKEPLKSSIDVELDKSRLSYDLPDAGNEEAHETPLEDRDEYLEDEYEADVEMDEVDAGRISDFTVVTEYNDLDEYQNDLGVVEEENFSPQIDPNLDAVTSDEEEGFHGGGYRKRSQESIDYTEFDPDALMTSRQIMIVSTSDAEEDLVEEEEEKRNLDDRNEIPDALEPSDSLNNEEEYASEDKYEEKDAQVVGKDGYQLEEEYLLHDIQQPESINERIQHPIDLELATIPEERSTNAQDITIPEFDNSYDV